MARHGAAHVSIPKIRKVTLRKATGAHIARAKRPVRGSTTRSMGNRTVRRNTNLR